MRKNPKKRAFTIVELLVVMSIIIILISLLVPSLNAVRRYARGVTQKGQFHNIENALELFLIDHGQYPDSATVDTDDPVLPYCGAMKMCEAVMGQDGFGFHPDSKFYASGLTVTGAPAKTDPDPEKLYLDLGADMTDPANKANLRERKSYLQPSADKMELHKIDEYFLAGNYGQYPANCAVIADVFKSNDNSVTGEKIGLPVLYYRANVSKMEHDANGLDPATYTPHSNTYDFYDNQYLVNLFELKTTGALTSIDHQLYNPDVFYRVTLDKKSNTIGFDQPYRKDSYILISAGFDGLYGTRDDICNFKD